jgi:hypothetical protein
MAKYLLLFIVAATVAIAAHLAATSFESRVRFNLILRGHPFAQFVPATSGSPFLPNTMISEVIRENERPIGCADPTGEVFLADDHGREKINGGILMVLPELLEQIFGAIAVVAIFLMALRSAHGRGNSKGT